MARDIYALAMNTTKGLANILRISDSEYNSIKAMNATGLKKFSVSPMHYKHWLDTKDTQDDSGESLRFGRALHCLCLEGQDTFNNKFAITPVVDRRTKEGKLAWQNFLNENAGRDFVTPDEFSSAQQMADRFRSNKMINEIIEAGVVTEGVLLGNVFGSPFKGRFDMYCPSLRIMLDLKSISKPPTHRNVSRAMSDYDYRRQEAVYRKLAYDCNMQVEKFIFTFMEKDCPHGIAHVSNSEASMHFAYIELEQLALDYKECLDLDVWPGAPCESHVMEIS